MHANESLAESLASLTESERRRVLADLTPAEAEALEYDWKFWARPNQLPPPGDWDVWALVAGRGFGKTRPLVEFVREKAQRFPGCRIAMVANDPGDARKVLVEGESGILACCHPDERPIYEPSKKELRWANGTLGSLYSAEDYDDLRGPQHHFAIVDEFAKFRWPQETWDNLVMGTRLGDHPQIAVATTPRPIAALKALIADARTVLTRGTTYENLGNLAPSFIRYLKRRYEGTRLGRQELDAEMLDDAPGALWRREWFDRHRVSIKPNLRRVVVALDPSGQEGDDEGAAEAGIIGAGIGIDGRGYLLADRSDRLSPEGWARAAILLYLALGANEIVAEKNHGGAMVASTIRLVAAAMFATREIPSATIPVKVVWASQGKYARAEPVSALYEQGRVSHVGTFGQLEDQCCAWLPNSGQPSPDRLDAQVWAFTELLVQPQAPLVAPAGHTQSSYWRSANA